MVTGLISEVELDAQSIILTLSSIAYMVNISLHGLQLNTYRTVTVATGLRLVLLVVSLL